MPTDHQISQVQDNSSNDGSICLLVKNSAQLVRLPGSRANHTQPYPGLRVPRPFSPLRAELPAWAKDVEVLYLVHDGRCPLIIPFNGEGTVAQLETNQTHYSALPSLQLQSLQQSSQRCLEFLKNLPARTRHLFVDWCILPPSDDFRSKAISYWNDKIDRATRGHQVQIHQRNLWIGPSSAFDHAGEFYEAAN